MMNVTLKWHKRNHIWHFSTLDGSVLTKTKKKVLSSVHLSIFSSLISFHFSHCFRFTFHNLLFPLPTNSLNEEKKTYIRILVSLSLRIISACLLQKPEPNKKKRACFLNWKFRLYQKKKSLKECYLDRDHYATLSKK